MQKHKVTNRTTKNFNGLKVIAEYSDTRNGFFFRLVCGKIKSQWSSYYEGIHTLDVAERKFILLSAFWSGNLTVEEPLEIIQGK